MPKSDYSFAERLFHRFALGNKSVTELSFKIDQSLYKPDLDLYHLEKHIFVAGLARAGTTALMRLFYSTDLFTSLTYRDMPFPLASNLWGKIVQVSPKKGRVQERAHGDGLLVDFDSPEALEEVFWRIFCGDEYILPDRLIPMQADQNVIDVFRSYISGLLGRNGKKRYLSKNNNNILRLCSISKAFPQAIILIPFRDPLQQALSLYNQHIHFLNVHKKDKFASDFMSWLVHHEFGSDHRYFEVDHQTFENSPEQPVYWLEQWIRVYRFLLRTAHEVNLIFVCYEDLCTDPEAVWQRLANYAELPEDLPSNFILKKAPEREDVFADNMLKDEAYQIYNELKFIARQVL